MTRSAAIASGSTVHVRTADGRILEKVAITGVIDGRDFPVVWVVWPHEYVPEEAEVWENNALRARMGANIDEDELPGCPWPEEDVWLA